MTITEPLVLPLDVILVPVEELPQQVRDQVQCEEGDYAITRPRSRTPSSIIDSHAAELLGAFRTPTTIVEAVINYSRERQMDPEETLVEAYPLIQRFMSSRLLVAAGSGDANKISASLEIGEQIGDFEVLRCVQVLEDTELYQVKLPGGEEAALKIARPGYSDEVRAAFDREAAILKYLDGAVAPRLLREGMHDERRYLALEWCPGVPASQAGEEARRTPGWAGRRKLLALSTGILRAYAQLHSRGVIHSDIHPRNVLVDADGSLKIIDFGLARLEGDRTLGIAERGGVGFFFEPEWAVALGRQTHSGPPASTMLGEQYSLAALLYLLLTGAYYLDFSLERSEMLRQIAEDNPVPFARRGIAPWGQVEKILARALRKDPAERFGSLDEFVARLAEVEIKEEKRPAPGDSEGSEPGNVLREVLEGVLERASMGGPLMERGFEMAPTCSVTYGMAGLAYTLYRMACVRDDPSLLALADIWITRAANRIESPDAFYNDDIDITPELVGQVSPYHTASGIYCVQALLAHARGDAVSQSIALQSFLVASEGPANGIDLTLGSSGTLLAASMLLDTVRDCPYLSSEPLIEMGERTLLDLWRRLDSYGPIGECREITYPGIAHGWAGFMYATLRWCKAAGRSTPTGLGERLAQLAALAEPWGSGVRWPWTLKPPNSSGSSASPKGGPYMPGWCNGSAGYVFLWASAHRILGGDQYLSLAEKAAWNAWEEPDSVGQLCCGLTGRAYALLKLYKQTGDEKWLDRARDLALRAAYAVRSQSLGADSMQDSLYKGEVGVALLAVDLTRPETACLPFFEEEE